MALGLFKSSVFQWIDVHVHQICQANQAFPFVPHILEKRFVGDSSKTDKMLDVPLGVSSNGMMLALKDNKENKI